MIFSLQQQPSLSGTTLQLIQSREIWYVFLTFNESRGFIAQSHFTAKDLTKNAQVGRNRGAASFEVKQMYWWGMEATLMSPKGTDRIYQLEDFFIKIKGVEKSS